MERSPAALLLDDLDRLCGGQGCRSPRNQPLETSPFEGWPPFETQAGVDGNLLAGLRAALARVAEEQGLKPHSDVSTVRAVRAVLDGAQLTARTELLSGNEEEVRRLIPTFVYLVVLPVAGENAARHAFERAAAGLSAETESASTL